MKLKYSFQTMKLNDKMIAVPIGSDSDEYQAVVRLNETAFAIFNLLQTDTTEEEILDAMEKEFDTSRDVLAADIHRFIEGFKEKGLLV